jgi:hypothetical protein
MGRHANRARVYDCDGAYRYSTSRQKAEDLIKTGRARQLTSEEDLKAGEALEIQLKDEVRPNDRRKGSRTASITSADMVNNAVARADGKKTPTTAKVNAWPREHDKFSVTVLPQRRVWVPNPKAAAARAAELSRK